MQVPRGYRRRRPEQGLLHRILADPRLAWLVAEIARWHRHLGRADPAEALEARASDNRLLATSAESGGSPKDGR